MTVIIFVVRAVNCRDVKIMFEVLVGFIRRNEHKDTHDDIRHM